MPRFGDPGPRHRERGGGASRHQRPHLPGGPRRASSAATPRDASAGSTWSTARGATRRSPGRARTPRVINDYNWLRLRLRGTPLQALGPAPPASASRRRCAPRPAHLLERAPHCEIVNAGRAGVAARPRTARGSGAPIPARRRPLRRAVPDGRRRAPCPFYGLGMRAFPFAGTVPGALHLRVVGRIAVPTVLLNLPRIWSGAFRHPGLHDFHADRVTVPLRSPSAAADRRRRGGVAEQRDDGRRPGADRGGGLLGAFRRVTARRRRARRS